MRGHFDQPRRNSRAFWRTMLKVRAQFCLLLFAAIMQGCCFVGHDQLKLPDPSPCHLQCDYTQVAPIDPECHGYHPTCWSPWSADCCGCPPPPSGVYPIIEEAPHLEPVPPAEINKSLPPPSAPGTPSSEGSELPAPDFGSHPPGIQPPPPAENPASPQEPMQPSQTMPAPQKNPEAPSGSANPEASQSEGTGKPGESAAPSGSPTTEPELPPLLPPGRKIPGSSAPQKPPKRIDQDTQPISVPAVGGFEEQSESFEMPDPLFERSNESSLDRKLDIHGILAQAMQSSEKPSAATEALGGVVNTDVQSPAAKASVSPDDDFSISVSAASPLQESTSAPTTWYEKIGGFVILCSSALCGLVWMTRTMSSRDERN